MSETVPVVSQDDLNCWLAEWQERLRLQDWRVETRLVRYHEVNEGCGANIVVNVPRRSARISVMVPGDEPPDGDVSLDSEGYLVHELLHLVFVHYDPASGVEDDVFEQGLNAMAAALVSLKRCAIPVYASDPQVTEGGLTWHEGCFYGKRGPGRPDKPCRACGAYHPRTALCRVPEPVTEEYRFRCPTCELEVYTSDRQECFEGNIYHYGCYHGPNGPKREQMPAPPDDEPCGDPNCYTCGGTRHEHVQEQQVGSPLRCASCGREIIGEMAAVSIQVDRCPREIYHRACFEFEERRRVAASEQAMPYDDRPLLPEGN